MHFRAHQLVFEVSDSGVQELVLAPQLSQLLSHIISDVSTNVIQLGCRLRQEDPEPVHLPLCHIDLDCGVPGQSCVTSVTSPNKGNHATSVTSPNFLVVDCQS